MILFEHTEPPKGHGWEFSKLCLCKFIARKRKKVVFFTPYSLRVVRKLELCLADFGHKLECTPGQGISLS